MVEGACRVFASLLDECDATGRDHPEWQPTAAYLIERYGVWPFLQQLGEGEKKALVEFLRDVQAERARRLRNELQWGHEPISADYALEHICYDWLEALGAKIEYPSRMEPPPPQQSSG